MNNPERTLYEPVPQYRERERVPLWSVEIELNLPCAEFQQVMIDVASKTRYPYTGFVTRDEKGDVTTFTLTRYPRKKYGIPSVPECEEAASALGQAFDGSVLTDQRVPNNYIRVVLGLREGYESDAPSHDIDEVRQALPPEVSVIPAEVFAIRRDADGVLSIYTEPVAVIIAPSSCMADIYTIGDGLRQERFTVEDFTDQQAYVVETRHCTNPDPD